MTRQTLHGILLLLGGLLVMTLKCAVLLRAGARRGHTPEADER